MESIVAATAGVAKLFMREEELGKIQPGYFADCILVNGDPLEDITVLQDHSKLDLIMINGRIHKAKHQDFVRHSHESLSIEQTPKLYNFIAYRLGDGTKRTRIGHLDTERGSVTPIAYKSGTPI
jgi:adenine deaminase